MRDLHPEISPMAAGADLDGEHRYHLFRRWDHEKDTVVWVMLNPSTADASEDDPTIRKCMGFARRWGFGAIDVVNLYSYRATSPRALKAAGYPNGPRADDVLAKALGSSFHPVGRVVFGWGRHGLSDRVAEVEEFVEAFGCPVDVLALNKDGSPRHPLYVPYETEPVPFRRAPGFQGAAGKKGGA